MFTRGSFRACLVLALECRTLVDSRRACINRFFGPKRARNESPESVQKKKGQSNDAYQTFRHAWYKCCIQEGGTTFSFNRASKLSDRECCQMVAEHETSRKRSAQAWVRLGSIGGAVVRSQNYSVIQCYEQAVAADPTGNNWMNLALVHVGSPQGVEYRNKAYQAVVDGESHSPFAWMMLGRIGGGFIARETCGQHAMRLAVQLAQSIANDARSVTPYVHRECVPLWEALKESCSSHIKEKYEWTISLGIARALCHDFLRLVWTGDDSDVNYVFLQSIYDLFIGIWQGANLRSSVRQLFWAGFSHGLGTREAVDVFANWKDRSDKLWIGARDVEHEATPLGRIMRHQDIGWARACHRTKNDVHFWKAVSKAYAGNERLGYKSSIPYRINILINYMASQIDNSFLSLYEIPIIRDVCSSDTNRDCQIVVVDFQNDCGHAIQHLIGRLNVERTACICPQQRLQLQSDFRWLGKDHLAFGRLPQQDFLDASKGAMMAAYEILKSRS